MASKIVVTGGFGAGKTTFVTSLSEIEPLTSEAPLTGIRLWDKRTTTVAMDFGRVTIDGDLVLYLFGTPGQDRFCLLWNDIMLGAAGAIVLVDTRKLADGFAAVDYFEARGLPFVVGVNHFHGVATHTTDQVREALSLPAATPVYACDARRRASTTRILTDLMQHIRTTA
ncbi:ATP/GTP-binding protein [Actinocrispum sp. NPDC049592]|uniref:GTP-binding protein n=1 Tax=Actinocrispum sp. NPDC049592 TaxID=3154835 RepID=UPI0034169BEA